MGQTCSSLVAAYSSFESRCAATGSIKVNPSGGSGSYKYKTLGPVNSNYTTSDSITGLSAGIYSVLVNDIVTNCLYTIPNVIVPGSYKDPRFTLFKTDVSCDNGSNGGISVSGQQFGRSPFTYSIVAPSPAGIGTSNSTGIFTGLVAGDYRIRMTDSCGGIQTRGITINNYTWRIDSTSFNKISCDSAGGFIKVSDSKGNISTAGGIPGFLYGAVRSPGDTIWSSDPNFSIYLAGQPTIELLAKDSCGKIKSASVSLIFHATVGATVNVYNQACSTFSASLTNITNFFNPQFCLKDSNNVTIYCNTSGVFGNLAYGSYCINAYDSCADTTIKRCFNVLPPAILIGNNVNITNKNCTDFTVSITGQSGVTNPTYCLYDAASFQMLCNTTGVFNNLAYGSYCIQTKDGCRDTTIERCFTVLKPIPLIPPLINPVYNNCETLGIAVTGDSLYQPRFCLYDSNGVIVTCNNTGIFNSLPLANYCVNIYDSCLDTTIIRCFDGGNPILSNDIVIDILKGCTSFNMQASTENSSSIQHCLYDFSNTLIVCDSTGIFNQLPYGTYCLKSHFLCTDTTFTSCFTVSALVPSVGATVAISNKSCSAFDAEVTGQQNLTNPQYCIYDSTNLPIGCNTTGIFNNLPFGNYCIKIINTCFDTTIARCFAGFGEPVDITAVSTKSCSYGYAKFSVSVVTGTFPVNLKIYHPDGTIFVDEDYPGNNINIDSIPGAIIGQSYKVVVRDNCGNTDSINVSSLASFANHTPDVIAQCPSSIWLNGSGKIRLTTSSNMGQFTVRLIKKNGTTLTPQVTPNTSFSGVFTFNDLEPATYIIRYKLNDVCSRYLYDTVIVYPYLYPNLNRSSAYQCNVSGFSVGAVASNGVGPFSYEIISSTPSSPSINAGPQADPIFHIDNGNDYSLIRLRALDACGNATLGDASILPLASYGIEVTSNCFQTSTTLSVDTIYNSTYEWFKKDNMGSTDSTYLGSGYSQYIPYFTPADTGIYICKVLVNSGCVSRSYYYNLNGVCYNLLTAVSLNFEGKLINNQVLLNWQTTGDNNLKSFIIERKTRNNPFEEIGKRNAKDNATSLQLYDFLDTNPENGNNYYRLKLLNIDNSFAYSSIISVNKKTGANRISVYPNPASVALTISFNTSAGHTYKVILSNMANQVVSLNTFKSFNNSKLIISRGKLIGKGIYILRCIDLNTNEEFFQRVIFQ